MLHIYYRFGIKWDSLARSRWGQLWHSGDCMRGPDVHVTGYDPGPATDQWSCDCGQHARRSKACISVRVSSRPTRNLSQVIMITRKEEELWSMGVGWWENVPSLELSKKGAPCWGAVIPVAEMAMRFFAGKISPSAHVLWFAFQRQSQHCLNRKHTLDQSRAGVLWMYLITSTSTFHHEST